MPLHAIRTSVALCALLGCATLRGHAQAGGALAPAEQQMVASVDRNTAADTALIERLVDINSGTMHLLAWLP